MAIDQECIGGVAASRARALVAVALLAAGLAGCGSISEDTAAKVAFAPGHFDYYTCKDIEERATTAHRRQEELEQLMTRAEQGAGGAFVSAIAYRSEYAQTRGEVAELKRMANERQCAIDNKYSSGRALF
jgi:hypothetical protein